MVHVLDRTAQVATIYIDGKSVGTPMSLAAWTDVIDCSAAALYELGGWSTFWYAGAMDEFAIFSRAFSATEVEALAKRRPDGL